MRTDKELVNRAMYALNNVTNNVTPIKAKIAKDDVKIKIGGIDFDVITVKSVTTGSKGIITNNIKEAEQKGNQPIILIADYIPLEIAKEFKSAGINYIEASGNTYLMSNNLWLFISGQKRIKTSKTNQSRAFQETGIKLVFGLLARPELIKSSYRELSETVGISLASTGYVMQELTDLNFLLKTADKRVLKNKKELLNRWVIAYHDVLRPRILKRKMRFIDKASYANWKRINLNQTKEIKTLWGCEPAASILTNHLKPSFFSIYTTNSWQECAKNLGLVPDENGDIEILQMFWNFINPKEKDLAIVPPILIYADLINSANDRNVETAEIVFDNELQYIK